MQNQDLHNRIHDARLIVDELHDLLHQDAIRRLRIYNEYSHDPDADKWSPNLYRRCQLVDALRRKLSDQ